MPSIPLYNEVGVWGWGKVGRWVDGGRGYVGIALSIYACVRVWSLQAILLTLSLSLSLSCVCVYTCVLEVRMALSSGPCLAKVRMTLNNYGLDGTEVTAALKNGSWLGSRRKIIKESILPSRFGTFQAATCLRSERLRIIQHSRKSLKYSPSESLSFAIIIPGLRAQRDRFALAPAPDLAV